MVLQKIFLLSPKYALEPKSESFKFPEKKETFGQRCPHYFLWEMGLKTDIKRWRACLSYHLHQWANFPIWHQNESGLVFGSTAMLVPTGECIELLWTHHIFHGADLTELSTNPHLEYIPSIQFNKFALFVNLRILINRVFLLNINFFAQIGNLFLNCKNYVKLQANSRRMQVYWIDT